MSDDYLEELVNTVWVEKESLVYKLASELLQLREQIGWKSVNEIQKVLIPGVPSKPYLVRVKEFGCKQTFAIATAWVSIETPLFPKWYLDLNFYHLNNLIETSPVTHFYDVLNIMDKEFDLVEELGKEA
jgi:hypothetical protein